MATLASHRLARGEVTQAARARSVQAALSARLGLPADVVELDGLAADLDARGLHRAALDVRFDAADIAAIITELGVIERPDTDKVREHLKTKMGRTG